MALHCRILIVTDGHAHAMAVLCYESNTGFSAAILPRVDRSG